MQSVAALLGRELELGRRLGLTEVEHSVFGTTDSRRITRLLERFCESQLGSNPGGAHFYASSVGCVIGLRLESGADVVVKAYQGRWHAPFLSAVQEVQRVVAAGGIPCPRPLAAPAALAPDLETLAMVESWLPDPGMRAVTSARARTVCAAGLARQIALCDGIGYPFAEVLHDHPLRTQGASLYGEPHSPHFDFEGTARGAEWIDALARRAAAGRDEDTPRPVVSHTDWSARNVRLDDDRLLAVYDWDSAASVAESTAIGQAAITWCVTSEAGGTTFPTAEEVARFVGDYERAAGRILSEQQYRAAGSAAAYTLAYTARCEHSLTATSHNRVDPRAARHRLAESAEELLDLRRPTD